MSRCEAMVPMHSVRSNRLMYVMCGSPGAQLHHQLTRARGGLLLDAVGETHHHLYLCQAHHAMAHDEGSAFERGLLIRGSVVSGLDGKPVYTGPDEYLNERYGEQVHTPEASVDDG